MPVSRQLVWWTLLACCRGAASALDGDAPEPIPDRAKEKLALDSGFRDRASTPFQDQTEEILASGSGFGDPDASAPGQRPAKEISAPDSGFLDLDVSAPIPDRAKEMPSPDSGFSYLETERYHALKEKLRGLPLPNKKLLPHLTYKFATLLMRRRHYPDRFREAHIGGDKDLMNGIKLYRSAVPRPEPQKLKTHFEYLIVLPDEYPLTETGHADTMLSDNPPTRRGSADTMSSSDSQRHSGYIDTMLSDNPPTRRGSSDTMSSSDSQRHSGYIDTMPSDNPPTRRGSSDVMPSGDSQRHSGYIDTMPSDNPQTQSGHADVMPSHNPQTHGEYIGMMPSDNSPINDGYLQPGGQVGPKGDGLLHVTDVSFLQDHNVKNVINLNPLDFSPDSQLLLQNAGIHVDHIPIKDWTAPTLQQINTAIDSIENARRSGASSWVFCGYGDGRTGTIVAAYEIWKIFQAYPDLSPADLQTYVMRRNGYIKVAHETFPVKAQAYQLVNAYDTHKIENIVQIDSLLEFANQISAQTKCLDI